jgi:hypothetical protein
MSKKRTITKNANIDSWPTKKAAAEYLGLAEKTLDRMAERGEIQKGLRRQPGRPPVVVFHPDDIERAKQEREPEPFVLPTNGTNGTGRELQPLSQQQQTTAAALVQVLTAIADRIAEPPAQQLKEPFFLTMRQAREVSGLPPSYLREHFVESGRAVKTGRGWRIRRADLEQLGRDGQFGQVSKVSEEAGRNGQFGHMSKVSEKGNLQSE